ncbi:MULTISPECIES: type II toxin-antitoxin system HicA family toxin [Clostridium]|uniref:YcfA-like protein n=2 Tax=Clostridium TaxID=1485 RepID=A0A1A6AVY4_9CLOT|nr:MULTISPECIES: type II toxin-antitoxin system HicA family toxin [Clostridium]OBR94244.1 YcfA-like protein [Clostridium ragsdalei P11]QXE18269.1 toxin HicA [Clostridium sp. 001]RMC98587.1 type II toxin-antitoxin system HicA family toxin [Clostridium autoethanogenum]
MTSKEIIKLAEDKSWEIKKQRGSHIKLIHKDLPKQVIIPYHGTKEVPKGTLNSILKQLGLK